MKKILFLLIITLTLQIPLSNKAQTYIPEYHNHHLYFHLEMSSGNIYPLAVWSTLSGALNSAFNYNFMESEFAYDLYCGDGFKHKNNSPIGFSVTELFNHIQPGIKIGYYSDYIQSSVNWGLLATVGYKINQFGMEIGNDYCNQNIQRIQLGGLAILALGRNGGDTQTLIELGLKYNIAAKYKSASISDKKALNNGLTSHFALKFGGSGWIENIGIFADLDHYNIYNSSFEYNDAKLFQFNNLRNITLGICLTLTPDQVNRRRNY